MFQSRLLMWQLVLVVTRTVLVSGDVQRHPTVVPGSSHLVMQEDFPYEFWSANGRPVTPAVPQSRNSYEHYYGDERVDYKNDPGDWQILPIQIPDDLVGNASKQTIPTTPRVPNYPTSATPQYGRHPGATEAQHLFHPERRYQYEIQNSPLGHHKPVDYSLPQHPGFNNWTGYNPGHPNPTKSDHNFHSPGGHQQEYSNSHFEPQIPRPVESSGWSRRPPQASSWQESLMETLEPLFDSSLVKLPSLPKLPGFNSIVRLPKLPLWPFNTMQGAASERNDYQQEITSIPVDDTSTVHQFYPILNNGPNRQSNRHGYNGPNHPSTAQNHHSQNNRRISHGYPTTHYLDSGDADGYADNIYSHGEEQSTYLSYNPVPQSAHRTGQVQEDTYNENYEVSAPTYYNHHYSKKRVQRPHRNRIRPFRKLTNSLNNLYNSQWNSGSKADNQDHRRNSRRPSSQRQMWRDRYYQQEQHLYQPQETSWATWQSKHLGYDTSHQNNRIQDGNHFNPSQNINEQQRHPLRQSTRRPYWPSLQWPRNQDPHSSKPIEWQEEYHEPQEQGIIERITGVEAGVAVPGGMLAVGMSLALFYFNYVWYPTPVVTAKLGKVLPDSMPTNHLSDHQQATIDKVYEVFRSLEDTQGSEGWSPECKSRFVCQVHQELPGLWKVTEAFDGYFRSTLSMETEEHNEVLRRHQRDSQVDTYLLAGQLGAQGSSCQDHYPNCHHLPNLSPLNSILSSLTSLANLNT